jgi:predicted DNA-binding transcriptional regulator AlpA
LIGSAVGGAGIPVGPQHFAQFLVCSLYVLSTTLKTYMREYQPITKDRAAEVLSVSKRTINNLVAKGIMPTPSHIGRRIYWHPETFFAWLDLHLVSPEAKRPSSSYSKQTGRRGRPRKSECGG